LDDDEEEREKDAGEVCVDVRAEDAGDVCNDASTDGTSIDSTGEDREEGGAVEAATEQSVEGPKVSIENTDTNIKSTKFN
jgi:hypothetical protein